MGGKPHGSDYWDNNGVTNPTNKDYIYHIEFNHVHHYGLGIQSDFGGIYLAASYKCDDGAPIAEIVKHCYTYKHVFNNLIHDVQTYQNGGNFIYTDKGSCKNTIENNLLIGATGIKGSYIKHACGLDNVSKNNVIHRNNTYNTANYMWGGCMKTLTDSYQQFVNHHNVYLLENIDNLSMWRPFDRYWNHSWDNHLDQAPKFWDNLYWSPNSLGKDEDIFPGKKTWDQWIDGNDTDSSWVDENPFVDANAGDYTLKKDSPAFAMGINQIILGNFGVQESLRYASSLN